MINILSENLDETYTVFYHPHFDIPSSEMAIMNKDGGVLLLQTNENNSLMDDERIERKQRVCIVRTI